MGKYQFQQDAIEAAIKAFHEGRKRYLIADEAGLGKTHVAKGVIDAKSSKENKPIIVFYFGSNVHLLKNTIEKKLIDDKNKYIYMDEIKGTDIDRLSIAGAAAYANLFKFDGKVYIFAFSANLIDSKNSKSNENEKKFIEDCLQQKPDPMISEKNFQDKREYFNGIAFGSLKPDLVIVDEFHRYYDRMQKIGEYSKESDLLLLSATPYIVKKDDWKNGDYSDKVNELIENEEKTKTGGFSFIDLLGFLINDDKEKENYLSTIWEKGNREEIEEYLKRYIWRNERVVLGEKYQDIPSKKEFFEGKYDECIGYALDCGNANKRFFSLCPGAWSFGIIGLGKDTEGGTGLSCVKEYSVLKKSRESGNVSREDFLFNDEPEIMSKRIKTCLRTRLIYEYAVEAGRNLLWVPPSYPIYEFGDPFKGNEKFSKLLVFSGYAMVPRMIATVFSELADNEGSFNDVDEKKVKAAIAELSNIDNSITEEKLNILKDCWDIPDNKNNKISIESILKGVKEAIRSKEIEIQGLEPEVLAKYTVASPLICAYRILKDVEKSRKIAKAFIAYFNQAPIVKCLKRQNCLDVNALLEYCVDGNLQAMLYEYAFSSETWFDMIPNILTYEGSSLFVLKMSDDVYGSEVKCRFAERYSPDANDSGVSGTTNRGETNLQSIEDAFQSPFWPMILSTTSAGQEGIDMDAYCSRIMHYSIPSTPMAFEQRDGRVDRRRSLLARRKMVYGWGQKTEAKYDTFWEDIFNKDKGFSGLSPDWVQMNDASDLREERIIPFFPYSSEYVLYRRLVDCKNIYRSQMGNPNEVNSEADSDIKLKLNNVEIK